MTMWTRPADRAPSYGPCGQGVDKYKALAHPLPALGALAPTSSPLRQQRFMGKTTPPAPTGSDRLRPAPGLLRHPEQSVYGILRQILAVIPRDKARNNTCLDQFLCMAFAQLTFRESLRDIEACLRAHQDKLYHMGIRGGMSRNTLANANQRRDWRIYAEFAQAMIRIARPLYANEDLGLELDNTVYALDASTIDLCLSVFPWALFRSTKSAVKLHTLLDLRGNIPTFIHVSDGKMHDVNVLDILVPEPGAFYIMDRGYVDFERLFLLHSVGAFFIIRAKSNTRYQRRYSRPVDKRSGVQCDQTVVLTGAKGRKHYPQPLRRIKYYDAGTQKTFNFLTNPDCCKKVAIL